MVGAPPKCREHNLALELVRVEISGDKVVTDIYRCPHEGCRTEHYSQQRRRPVESGKQEVADGTHGAINTVQQRGSGASSD
jgi:hypothetical protein